TMANIVPRKAGTDSAFQIPPSAARLPRVPKPGSARAANGATPARADGSVLERMLAASHGNATSTAAPKLTAAQRHRGRPPPGTRAHTSATVAASISPVGVRPAIAIHHTSGQYDALAPERSISI